MMSDFAIIGREALTLEDKDHDDNDYGNKRFQDIFVDVYKALRPYPDALRAVERTLAERLLEQEHEKTGSA